MAGKSRTLLSQVIGQARQANKKREVKNVKLHMLISWVTLILTFSKI